MDRFELLKEELQVVLNGRTELAKEALQDNKCSVSDILNQFVRGELV